MNTKQALNNAALGVAACVALLSMSINLHAEPSRALKPNSQNQSEHRVALVIGNSAYKSSPLKNPVNDARDVATKLRGLGFDVIERNNLQSKQIGGTLREFRNKLTPGAVALVFYAGHGLQIKGINYLPMIDAEINSEEDVPNQSIGMNQIMDVLEESKSRLNLVFLDACRNNPYARSFRSGDQGLARVSAPSGTLISYATRPGSVAADGNERNGLYTSKLLAQMDSNLQIELALKRVVTDVKAASQGKQEPWMEGSIEGDFCFVGCAGGEVVPVEKLAVMNYPVKSKYVETPEGKELIQIGQVVKVVRQYGYLVFSISPTASMNSTDAVVIVKNGEQFLGKAEKRIGPNVSAVFEDSILGSIESGDSIFVHR